MLGLELINGVKQIIVDFANTEGIVLSELYKTREEFNTFIIGFTIRAVKEIAGFSTREAYDVVMGEGAFTQLANDVWHDLQNN